MSRESAHLSLSGAGFLGAYHLGVITAFEEHFPDILSRKIVGTSAGSMVAACICCSIPTDVMLNHLFESMTKVRSFTIGAFNPTFDIVKELKKSLSSILPADAHKSCCDRLHVSLTRWRNGGNELINNFESNDDLIDAIIASSHIPLFSGFLPFRFRDKFYWDGGLSNICPRLDGDTVTVCPYSSPSIDICPAVKSHDASNLLFTSSYHFHRSMDNLNRLYRAFFPNDAQGCADIVRAGYDNAISFMMKEGIVPPGFIQPPQQEANIEGISSPSIYKELNFSTLKDLPWWALKKVLQYSDGVAESYDHNGICGSAQVVVKMPYWIGSNTVSYLFSFLRYDNNRTERKAKQVEEAGKEMKSVISELTADASIIRLLNIINEQNTTSDKGFLGKKIDNLMCAVLGKPAGTGITQTS